jgi:MFS family permease
VAHDALVTVEPPGPPTATTPVEEPVVPRRPFGGLLRQHDFRQLFTASAISQVGTQLTGLALPVLAVRVLDANAFEMGVLGACEFLAFLVIGLPSGAWVDRWRKQRVLVLNDVIRGLALVSLPVAWVADALTLGQVFVVATVMGVCTVFFDVADQSYLPDIVDTDDIGEGNAKLQATQSVAMLGGPAIAGVLIKIIGAPFTILIDAVSFLGSAFFVRRIRHVDTPPPREDRRPLVEEVREGLSFVLKDPLLWRITMCTSVSNLFSSMSGALLILFCIRDLGLDEGHIGIAMGLGAAGGLVGALLTPRINQVIGEGRTIPVSSVFWVTAGVLLPLAGTVIPPMLALIVSSLFFTFSVVVYNVTQVSFRQRLCPRPLLGRMNASIRFLVWGVMPIGGLLGGVIGQAYGARAVFWIAFVGGIVAALPVVFSPLVRMRDLPREMQRLT